MQPANPTFWDLIARLRATRDPAAEALAERLIRYTLVALALTPLLTLL